MPHPPPFSPSLIALNISGDLDGYTYYVTKHRKVVAYPAAPALRPPTPAQQVMRARFALAMQAWKQLPPAAKTAYQSACDKLSLCMWGANLYANLSLTDTGTLRETIQQQVGVPLSLPPDFTPAAMVLPGPSATAVAAWIALHYPP
jgi:hypothetical protein